MGWFLSIFPSESVLFTIEGAGGVLQEDRAFSSSFPCAVDFVFLFALAVLLPEAFASATYLKHSLLLILQPQPVW